MKWERGNFGPEWHENNASRQMIDDRQVSEIAKRYGITEEEAEAKIAERLDSVRVYISDRYQVIVADTVTWEEGWPEMVHLSIRDKERSALLDWRDLQEIKNDLVGEENEGVQLFPAESRLVDEANQFHLWVVKDPERTFPFGYSRRLVVGRKMAEACGATQRPLGKRKKRR